jgi:hypothetical protein
MDGHFVPNISLGAAIVQSIRPIARLPLESPNSALCDKRHNLRLRFLGISRVGPLVM